MPRFRDFFTRQLRGQRGRGGGNERCVKGVRDGQFRGAQAASLGGGDDGGNGCGFSLNSTGR